MEIRKVFKKLSGFEERKKIKKGKKRIEKDLRPYRGNGFPFCILYFGY
jgi:hypothetical protein